MFPRKPTLTCELVILRPFTSDDIDAMAPILAEPDLIRLTGSASTTAEALGASPGHDDRTRTWYETRVDQPDRLDLAIIDRASGRCVGESVINEVDETTRSCNFRILIGREGQGRGLGTEATRLTVAHVFAATDLHRIELGVFGFNPRARRAYEKAGFQLEGVRRDAFWFDGEPVDDLVMSILRTDPSPSAC